MEPFFRLTEGFVFFFGSVHVHEFLWVQAFLQDIFFQNHPHTPSKVRWSCAWSSWRNFLHVTLRLQYTFGSAIFFKFGFLGQNSGRRIISNFWKKFLKKAKYWRRNGGFTFSPEVKVYLLIDSPMTRMQSTETIFAGITCMDLTKWLLSWSALLFWLPSIFDIRRVSIKL